MSVKVPVETYGGMRAYALSEWDEKNNPYLTHWAKFHADPESFVEGSEVEKEIFKTLREDGIRDRWFSLSIPSFRLRGDMVVRYSFALPDRKALQAIKRHSPNGVLEIGAGTGYWAKLLTALRVDVVAYDLNVGRFGEAKIIPGRYYPVIQGSHRDALQKENHGRTLLLVWPTLDGPWANEALRLYRGQVVIYVGEGMGGCTANDAFHRTLERKFRLVEVVSIPQWWGIHDELFVYRRKH